jgi:O-antigen ligase
MYLAERISMIPARVKLLAMASIPTALLLGLIIAKEKFRFLVPLAVLALLVLIPVELSLGVFALSLPFENILTLGSDSKTALSAVAGAVAGSTLLCTGLVAGRLRTPPRAALWWGLFTAWTAFSVFWATDQALSMTRLWTVLTLFAVYLVTVSFRVTQRELYWVLLLTVTGGIVAAAMSAREFAGNVTVSGRATLAVGNNLANPNDFAASLILPFALAVAGMFSGRQWPRRALMFVGAGLMGAATLLTMSRGAMLALAVTVLAFMVRARIRLRMLIVLAVVALPLLFVPSLFFQRWQNAASSRGEGRLDIMLVSMEVIKHNAIIGTGLENFTVAYREYAGKALVFRGIDRPAHNVYLQVWGETGIIGLGLLLAAIWLQLKQTRGRAGPPDHLLIAAEAACWGTLAMGMSGNIQWNKPFWFAFMVLALVMQHHEQPEQEWAGTHGRTLS